MNKPHISVVICTHNPRADYLGRVFDALSSQSVSTDEWELLLVDNASTEPLALKWNLTWHPQARHVREETLGLTPARMRAIRESLSDLLVFVDDDNILDPDYLEQAMRLANQWPTLGAWGGQIRPQFEIEPESWTRPFWEMLAIREFEDDRWSNFVHLPDRIPCGAGMIVRKVVADAYAHKVASNRMKMNLDRKGSDLVSCGDSDLALTSVDMGLGTGQFTSLKVTHLIPASRLSEKYLLNLVEKVNFSLVILNALRGNVSASSSKGYSGRLLDGIQLLRMDGRSRKFELARRRGVAAAQEALAAQVESN